MKNKILTAAMVGTVGVGAAAIVKKYLAKKDELIQAEEDTQDDQDSIFKKEVLEEEVCNQELSKENIREALKIIFSQYSDSDLALALWCEGDEDESMLEKAVEEYTDELYLYMQHHCQFPNRMEGKRYDGSDIFDIQEELFFNLGVCICDSLDEAWFDRFDLYNNLELWILETGEIAQVRCISYEGEQGNAEYRFVEFYVNETNLCHFDIDTLVDGLNSILSEKD